MSLALAAKHIESQGRNKDSKLVHMTPEELKALNKLSLDHIGKPLSTNPKTGLPEAGFLDSILPTVVGFGLSAISGGAIPTWALAGGIGLATAALTGDIGSGIMAGLGAWSGAGLQEGLAKVGGSAQTAASTLGDQASNLTNAFVNPELATNAAMDTTGFSKALLSPTGNLGQGISGTGLNAADIVQANTAGQANQIANQVTRNIATTQGPGASIGNFTNQFAGANAYGPNITAGSFPGVDSTYRGIQKVFSDPAARAELWKNNRMDIIGSATPFVTGALGALSEEPGLQTTKEEENPFGLKRISKDFKGSFPTRPDPYYTATYPDYRVRPYGAADGGLMNIKNYASGKKVDASRLLKSSEDVMSGIEMATKRPVLKAPELPDVGIYADDRKYASMDPYERALAMLKDIKGASGISARGLPNLKAMPTLGTISTEPAMVEAELADQARRQIATEAKAGGLMDGHLGDYSDGGRLLKGPGDGVSDSIPATIGGKQAARLAEGEFVIPARIVSELGNGSTDAGAKRLYAMMDRIKAKRKKAKDIAADTKAYKLLPA